MPKTKTGIILTIPTNAKQKPVKGTPGASGPQEPLDKMYKKTKI